MPSATGVGTPIVDISSFIEKQSIELREAAAEELRAKCSEHGFVGIVGHGLSSDFIAKAFTVTKTLFDLPYEDKMKAPHPDATAPHRGYMGIGKENAAAKTATETDDTDEQQQYASTKDYRESYDIGSDQGKEGNIWLPEDVFPGFRQSATQLYWVLNEVANALVEAFIMSLKATEEEARSIRALHTGHNDQLRLYRYPSVPFDVLQQKNVTRLGAHRDWSLFTLLIQDFSGGLEYEDTASHNFCPAVPRSGVVYMNVGDMLMRISNGVYPSAFHRVSIPNRDSVAKGGHTPPRYSIPFFVVPEPDGVIDPLASLIKAQGNRLYKPVTYNTYHLEMQGLTLATA